MLSRRNSSPTARVRRPKSTASIKSDQYGSQGFKPMDPETARLHARAAASHAYGRAKGSQLPGVAVETGLSRNTSKASTSAEHCSQLNSGYSIRFTGPTADVTGRKGITRRQATGRTKSAETGIDRDRHPRPSHQRLSAHRVESFITAIPQLDEDSKFEDSIASTPSSYRKLRKAKSMFSPRRTSSAAFTNGTPDSKSNSKKGGFSHRFSLDGRGDPTLRTTASSLHNGTRSLREAAHESQALDAAISMARDQYVLQLEQQRLKETRSFLLSPRVRRSNKASQKKFRDSSSISYGSAFSSANQRNDHPAENKIFGVKARKLSNSFKNKLKRVFQRSSQVAEALPVQQVDASRPHFRDYVAQDPVFEQEYKDVPVPDRDVLSRVSSREALRAESLRSMHSNENMSNGNSRVTSWTNSTAANTMATAQTIDKKRLSIIQEVGGPHQPSSSADRYGIPRRGYGVFRKPLRSISGSGPVTGPVDGHRIYSALMRRIDENSQTAGQEEVESVRGSDYGSTSFPLSAVPPRNTSVNTQRTADSIRIVPDDSQDAFTTSQGVRLSRSLPFNPVEDDHTGEFFSNRSALRKSRTLSIDMLSEATGMTPQQIAEHNERVRPEAKPQLREVRSSFFPHSSETQPLSTSPYRQAVAGSAATYTGTNGHQAKAIIEQERRSAHPNGITLSRNGTATGSVSAYSRTSSGETLKPFDSSVSLVNSVNDDAPGTAVIITTRSTKRHPAVVPDTGIEPSSARSSNEWKRWMSSEVASLENQSTEHIRINEVYRPQRVSHQRESAQIHGDDVQIGSGRVSSMTLKQPLAGMHHNMGPRPVLKQRNSEQMVDRFPLLAMGLPAKKNAAEHGNPSSSQRSSVPSRKISNVENERYSAGQLGRRYSNVPRMTSQTSLHSTASNSRTPDPQPNSFHRSASQSSAKLGPANRRQNLPTRSVANFQLRYSPERANRLRRMQSSNPKNLHDAVDERFGPLNSHHQENQIISENSTQTTPDAEYNVDGAGLSGPVTANKPVVGTEKMLDLFLNSRRRNMRISEESGMDPVFL
ncbi:MAG: hypothetical protein M1830_009118 [Pleopsidium flavum]|nr:MAG: hypothetical protein M1830_009118 [Pleopsidium flavum]